MDFHVSFHFEHIGYTFYNPPFISNMCEALAIKAIVSVFLQPFIPVFYIFLLVI